MTNPTTVARSVAKDAERRARAALDDALTAHTSLNNADVALATAARAKANAGPALARAIAAARDVGITEAHLAELGITTPSARTLRRHLPRTTPLVPMRTQTTPVDGQSVSTEMATGRR